MKKNTITSFKGKDVTVTTIHNVQRTFDQQIKISVARLGIPLILIFGTMGMVHV